MNHSLYTRAQLFPLIQAIDAVMSSAKPHGSDTVTVPAALLSALLAQSTSLGQKNQVINLIEHDHRHGTDIVLVLTESDKLLTLEEAERFLDSDFDAEWESLELNVHPVKLAVEETSVATQDVPLEPVASVLISPDLVKHWAAYDVPDTVMTHQLEVRDNRKDSGQVTLTLAEKDAEFDSDAILLVCAEVGTEPVSGLGHVPAALVSFDADDDAFMLYKVGADILLVPAAQVQCKAELVGPSSEQGYRISRQY